MTVENYKAEQAKISKEIEKLKKQALFIQNKQRQSQIASIVRSMKEYSIVPEDLVAVIKVNHPSLNTPTILSDAIPSP